MIRDRKFYKTFLFLCLPIVLQNMISLGVSLADNLMLGRYAEVSLSGVTAANQVQFIYQNILMGVGEGMVILASQYWGGKKVAEMKKVAAVAMWFGGEISSDRTEKTGGCDRSVKNSVHTGIDGRE